MAQLPLPTLAALYLFGPVAAGYAIYRAYRQVVRSPTALASASPSTTLSAVPARLPEGMVDGEQSLAHLGRAVFELALLLLFTWVCENRPLFPHADKQHDFDLFYLVVFGLLAVAVVFTVHVEPEKPSAVTHILSREQTEEWKGVMQLIFLLYHQFALEETYPLIRLFISCYVFLTGFGNTSFFYTKRDYSLVRVLSMLWRLLFACLVLAMTHDNPVILYYIVPLHTFYFFVSYFTMMPLERQVNYTKYGLKIKLMLLAGLIYLVWEFPAVFGIAFGWLSDEQHPGAAVGASGTRYEWQFRSGLDHYSSLFGMVFASAFPLMEARINNGLLTANRGAVLFGVSASMVAVAAAWSVWLFPLPKFAYNSQHAYSFVFPMCAYLFLRNSTSWLRRVHLGLFAHAGKYTLETYLLQHHIWLTSNAKTVLVAVPGFPKLNFLLVSIVYFLCSVKLFDLTVKLKLLLIPSSDVGLAVRTLVHVGGAVGLSFLLAAATMMTAGDEAVVIVVCVVFAALTGMWLVLGRLHAVLGRGERVWLAVSAALMVAGAAVALARPDLSSASAAAAAPLAVCDANAGGWVAELPALCGESPGSHYALCDARAWTWDVMQQKRCGWKRAVDLQAYDRVLVWDSPKQPSLDLALALARIDDKHNSVGTKQLPASSKVQLVSAKEDNKPAVTSKTLVVCTHEDTYDECAQLTSASAAAVLVNVDAISTAHDQAALPVIDAHAVLLAGEKTASLAYDVVAQLCVNQARHEAKLRAPKQMPPRPTGAGLAHNPLWGALFLGVAFFALWTGDGFLGLVAVFGRLLGKPEHQVQWEQAVEKIHAHVPGLVLTGGVVVVGGESGGGGGVEMGERASTPVVKRAKDPEHLSDAEEINALVHNAPQSKA